tara:strand:- start:206 stop:1537 length:1332 start_codon:yes stop_codon:yes gene_type:complete
MITLKMLKWDNCFSYGKDNSINLNNSTLTQLVGTNGMGKSSIPLIIEEALYNKNSKGIKKADIQNRFINAGYNINLTFAVEDTDYAIDVRRSRGSIKVKLFEGDEDISSHTATNTYKTVEQILGLDFKTFTQLVYQNTNTSLQFLTATDANRKKFLIDLLNLEDYVAYYDVFRELARTSGQQLAELDGKSKTIVKWLDENKLSDSTILPMIKLPEYSEEDEKELRSLFVDFENISEKNQKINENNTYKQLFAQLDMSLLQSKLPEPEPFDDLISKKGRLGGYVSEWERKEEKYKNLEGTCPTCDQSIPEDFVKKWIAEAQQQVEEHRARLGELDVEIQARIKEKQKYKEYINTKREFEDLHSRIDKTLPTEVLDARDLSDKIDQLREQITHAKSQIQEIATQNEEERGKIQGFKLSLSKPQSLRMNLKKLQKNYLKSKRQQDI